MIDMKDYRLEDCLDVLIDYRGKSPTKSASGIPVISAKVVKDGRILHPIEQTIDATYYVAWMRRGYPKAGDVVLTTEGPLGEVAQLDSKTATYALGQRIVVLRGKASVLDNTFLKFLLLSPAGQERLKAFATGTTVAGISQKALRQISLSIPDVRVQKHIANLLGSLDDKIELNRRMNETLEAMAQAIFRDWFVDFGPTRRKLEGASDPVAIMGGLMQDSDRARALADLFPATLGDNGLPEGWEEEAIGELGDIVGGSTPSTAVPEFWEEGRHPWATPKDLSRLDSLFLAETDRCISDAGLAKISSGLSPAGTVLLSSRAPIGYLAVADVPVAVNQGFIAIRPSSRMSTAHILLWCRENMDLIKAHANGSTFMEISKKNFRPLPVVRGGNAVSVSFDQQVSPLLALIKTRSAENRTLAATRDLLLPKLMSGEIRLSEAEDLVEAAQ